MECYLEEKIDEDNKEATNDVDDVDISLNIVRQYQQSRYILPTGYEQSGINVQEKLIFNDPEDTAYDLKKETQDLLD